MLYHNTLPHLFSLQSQGARNGRDRVRDRLSNVLTRLATLSTQLEFCQL